MSVNRTRTGPRAALRGPVQKNNDSGTKAELQEAVRLNTDLSDMHFRDLDLRGITIDGISLTNVSFENCDLTGANISEARLLHCDFSNYRLFDACFCYTDFIDCTFFNVGFGATDFSEALIDDCAFTGQSCFTINFGSLRSFNKSIYVHDGMALTMNKPPIYLFGLSQPFIFLDRHVIIGGDVFENDSDAITLFNRQLQHTLIKRCTTYN